MRALNRVVSTVLAAVLLAAGIIAIYEIIRAALSQSYGVIDYVRLARRLRTNSWDDLGPILICSGATVLGLLLLLLGLRRGKPDALTLTPLADGVESATTRRSLQRTLRRAALETEGVSSAKVRLGRRRAVVKATSPLREAPGLADSIRERLEARLSGIALAHPLRLRIKTKTREDPA